MELVLNLTLEYHTTWVGKTISWVFSNFIMGKTISPLSLGLLNVKAKL
jgi:hypothetical protein